MKNFKYASPQDFLSMLQARTPYDDRHPAKISRYYGVGISREETVENEKQQEKMT
jgi:hypothetical protein